VITTRRRGAPLDLIVSEAMILANSTWGSWLAEHGVPGIYRSQAALAPGIKVRMGTKALPHAGLGVQAYAWSTSPLRRYVDLVNQWQIIACTRHGRTAALAAPFKPRDATLLAIVSNFDAAYTAYNGFQSAIERFWTLRWLQQQAVQELDAAVLHDGLVRALALPLVFRVAGIDGLARGTHVKVRVDGCDLLTLEVHARLLARLDEKPLPAEVEEDVDAEQADTELAAPLALAIDVADSAAQDPAHGVADAASPHGAPTPDGPSGT
jgi:exoribonuclease-2